MPLYSILNKRLMITVRLQALFVFFYMITLPAAGQKIATLEVILDRPLAGLALPVSTSLESITHLPDSVLGLLLVDGTTRVPVPFQIEHTPGRQLTWVVNNGNKILRFELVKRPAKPAADPLIKPVKENGTLTLKAGDRNLLRYQFETVMPPPGIDEVFKRSGFIHPLWSPSGQVLTRIQPPDHYHHYGLWNPWTHVLFDGDTVDFWNLNAKQGTVRFSGFTSLISGNIFGEYGALHDHIAYAAGNTEQVAIREIQTVRIYASENPDHYIADITVTMNCPDKPVRLLEYRYGGLGWRATEQWTKENSRVLTSDGKTRKDADGSTARWCIVEGNIDGENAGAVMMSYPANYNHPEPLRIWPENSNGNRGDMFANFSPTKNMDWPLKPGKNYVLKYRFIVFNGPFSKEKAELGWSYFAAPPDVKVTKH